MCWIKNTFVPFYCEIEALKLLFCPHARIRVRARAVHEIRAPYLYNHFRGGLMNSKDFHRYTNIMYFTLSVFLYFVTDSRVVFSLCAAGFTVEMVMLDSACWTMKQVPSEHTIAKQPNTVLYSHLLTTLSVLGSLKCLCPVNYAQ